MTLPLKIQSIRCYRTDFPREKIVLDRVRAAALHIGMTAGFEAGELFVCTRTLGTTDLMRTLFAT